MNYGIEISKHNQQAHLDIEHDIQKQQNGLFTFILRVNNGNIVDYNIVEYVDSSKYVRLKSVSVEEYTIAHYPDSGDKGNAIRSDNGERTT